MTAAAEAPADPLLREAHARLHALADGATDAPAPAVALAALTALARVQQALTALDDLGAVSEIRRRAPAEAARAADLHRVVLTRIDDGHLVAEAVHVAGDDAAAAALLGTLAEHPVRLEYPLVEGEVLRRRRPALVEAEVAADGRSAHGAALGWGDHVIAPVVLEGRAIGFLHGDRPAGPGVGALERDALASFAAGFATLFERAILRRRIRVQRHELRQIATWAEARASELADGAIDLGTDRDLDDEGAPEPAGRGDAALRDLLTRRELDVLELMVQGETNPAIARALVVSEGTVKFHVKNILRKLHATNRADATSRYLRLTLPHG